jgi:hypothetical protein
MKEIDYAISRSPGPSAYYPKEVKKNSQSTLITRPNGGMRMPMNLNNPLNYVKPLTVSVYFKN